MPLGIFCRGLRLWNHGLLIVVRFHVGMFERFDVKRSDESGLNPVPQQCPPCA